MTNRYSFGWSDPRAMFESRTPVPIGEYCLEHVIEVEDIEQIGRAHV